MREIRVSAESRIGHEEETVQQLAELYDRHERSVAPIQRFANRITAVLGRPLALAFIICIVVAWIGGNYTARLLGSTALEQFPFPDLSFVATIVALIVGVVVLAPPRPADAVAGRGGRLTLQIAVLSEKKIAKLIELVEEQRRDNPLLRSRIDHEADEMATASDPRISIESLERAAGDHR